MFCILWKTEFWNRWWPFKWFLKPLNWFKFKDILYDPLNAFAHFNKASLPIVVIEFWCAVGYFVSRTTFFPSKIGIFEHYLAFSTCLVSLEQWPWHLPQFAEDLDERISNMSKHIPVLLFPHIQDWVIFKFLREGKNLKEFRLKNCFLYISL